MAPEFRPNLGELLRTADSFVEIARAVCLHSALEHSIVAYHARSGRPLCTVDALDRTDAERLAWLANGWQRDPLLVESHARRTLVSSGDELVIPILEPDGIVATIRGRARTDLDLWTTSMLVAVRFAQLGITAAPDVRPRELTPRQIQIARLAAQGLRTRDIAAQLEISPSTVKKLLKHVFDRLMVDNRVELVHQLRTLQVELDVPVGVTHVNTLAIARAG